MSFLLLFRFFVQRFCRHDAVKLRIAGEAVHEGQDDVAIKKQPFAFTAVGDIRELVRRDIELLGEYLPVAAALIEKVQEVRVL
mgnify:CR=1 FL=1